MSTTKKTPQQLSSLSFGKNLQTQSRCNNPIIVQQQNSLEPYTTKHVQPQHFHDEMPRKQVTATSATRLRL